MACRMPRPRRRGSRPGGLRQRRPLPGGLKFPAGSRLPAVVSFASGAADHANLHRGLPATGRSAAEVSPERLVLEPTRWFDARTLPGDSGSPRCFPGERFRLPATRHTGGKGVPCTLCYPLNGGAINHWREVVRGILNLARSEWLIRFAPHTGLALQVSQQLRPSGAEAPSERTVLPIGDAKAGKRVSERQLRRRAPEPLSAELSMAMGRMDAPPRAHHRPAAYRPAIRLSGAACRPRRVSWSMLI